jgi:hypothetical protein
MSDEWGDQPVNDDELEAHDQAVETQLAHNRAVHEAAARLRAQRDARDLVRGEELADIDLPEPYRLDAFLARPLEPITHRIAGLMPMGARILLSAQWKAGKTTLRDNFVRSLVDGDPFLDRYEITALPEHGTVTILDFELDDQTLQRWLTDHQIENQHHVNVIPMRGRASAFDIRDPHLRERWAKQLQQIGTAVIVLDCLRPILDALGLDESHDAGLFLVAFDALLTECGAREALVIHHMGHTSERARGDSRLRDWPDAEWRLVRDKDPEDPTLDDPSGARYFTAYGRDVDHPQQELTYNPDTRHISLRAGAGDRQLTAKRRKTAAACQNVQRMVTAQPGIGKRALLTAISGHNPTITDAIEQLVEDGLITRHVDGQKHSYFPGAQPPELDITPTVPTVPTRTQGTGARTVPRPLGMGTVPGTPDTAPESGHGHDLPPLRGFANQTHVPPNQPPEEKW